MKNLKGHHYSLNSLAVLVSPAEGRNNDAPVFSIVSLAGQIIVHPMNRYAMAMNRNCRGWSMEKWRVKMAQLRLSQVTSVNAKTSPSRELLRMRCNSRMSVMAGTAMLFISLCLILTTTIAGWPCNRNNVHSVLHILLNIYFMKFHDLNYPGHPNQKKPAVEAK